jgi:poly-gamma-glutamate capsule biosynthesis protein CapA/YwtB (metallophosphatase superfamily)
MHHRITRLLGCVTSLAVLTAACAYGPQAEPRDVEEPAVIPMVVRNEQGAPVADAQIAIADDVITTDANGRAEISITAPVVARVSTRDTLVEPVVLDPSDGVTTVHLWDRLADDGTERVSMHFGGDVMLGRRYLDPEASGPLVTDPDSARAVVDDLGPLSSAADWTVVNLETVVGELPDEQALVAKRFLLQSTPYITEALDEMGVDLVTLGNNHAYDWGDVGTESTLSILDDAGMAHVGAGHTREEAVRGTLSRVGEHTVGTISFTTVNGSFVNDQLPDGDDEIPIDLPESEAWQYELRSFGYTETALENDDGDPLVVKVDERRIGDVWTIYDEWEDELGEAVLGDFWSAVIGVYPELQDWVARRDHGGAAPYSRSEMESEIARLRADGADTVTVQVHGGYQFADVPSSFVRTIAHRAIDAGADIVIAHHPHVLQGVEWYDGKLIAYSLGNLVFDQDFLATFPSAMLRIISDGTSVLEARILPVMLDRYRPVPVGGRVAQQIIRMIDHRSAIDATSKRVDGLRVGSVFEPADPDPDADGNGNVDLGHNRTQEAAFIVEHNSGLITTSRVSSNVRIIDSGIGPTALPPCTLVRSDLLPAGTQIGTDLFDWGHFDNASADGLRRRPMHWKVSTVRERWDLVSGASGEDYDDAFSLFTDPNAQTSTQIAARFDVRSHRLFDADANPLDTEALYEIILDVKRNRGEIPSIRLVSFHFDDTNPTADPESARLNEVSLPIDAPADDEWHHVTIQVPDELFAPGPDGTTPNSATLLVDVPAALRGALTIDNVQVVEWRGPTPSESAVWVEGDLARSESPGAVNIVSSGC